MGLEILIWGRVYWSKIYIEGPKILSLWYFFKSCRVLTFIITGGTAIIEIMLVVKICSRGFPLR